MKQRQKQYDASRTLLKDFHREFPNIVTRDLYKQALNMHRKIEIGNNPKYMIVLKSIGYYLLTLDRFYVHYLFKKIKNFASK